MQNPRACQLEAKESSRDIFNGVQAGPPRGPVVSHLLHVDDGVHHGLLGEQACLLHGSPVAHKVAVEM